MEKVDQQGQKRPALGSTPTTPSDLGAVVYVKADQDYVEDVSILVHVLDIDKSSPIMCPILPRIVLGVHHHETLAAGLAILSLLGPEIAVRNSPSQKITYINFVLAPRLVLVPIPNIGERAEGPGLPPQQPHHGCRFGRDPDKLPINVPRCRIHLIVFPTDTTPCHTLIAAHCHWLLVVLHQALTPQLVGPANHD